VTDKDDMDVVQPLAAIVLVMALLGGVLLILKKRGAASFRLPGVSGSAPRRLEVMERVSLGPHHALHLVRAGGRVLMVVTGPNCCELRDYAVQSEEKA
jgi:flagellar biogenesis protein FliO